MNELKKELEELDKSVWKMIRDAKDRERAENAYQYYMNGQGNALSLVELGLMFRKKVSQTKLAKELGITQGGLHYKLMNNAFTYKDLIIIFHQLELTDEEIVRLMKV